MNLIDSIEKSSDFEIILVDNNSTDGSWESFRELKIPNLVLVRNKENLGFSKGVNVGIRKARGEYILLLNSDVKVKKGSILALVDFAKKTPDAGVVAPKLILGNGEVQKSVFHFPTIWGAFKEYILKIKNSYGPYLPKSEKPQAVDVVVGAAFLIKREVLEKVGLFDERYFMYFEDIDYCRRVWRAGYKVYYLPAVSMIHYHGQSVKKIASPENQWKMLIPSSKIYFGVFRHWAIYFVTRFGSLIDKVFQNSLIRIVFILIIFIFLTFPVVRPLLRKGYFYMQDDLQAFRLHQMDKCFKDLQFPCRWVPDAGYQYGYPQFNFYPPFVYYLGELIHLSGFQFVDVVKILFILGYVFSALAIFILIRTLVGFWPALVGSVVYTYAPYKAVEVYVRGALSEFWSFVFFPLIFWSSYLLIKTDKRKYLIFLSLFLAFLLTTHVLMSMAFIVPFALWVVFWLIKERKFKTSVVLNLFFSFFLAFCLSAFFVLPLFFERKFVHVETMIMGYFDYRKHFLGIYKLIFDRDWGYGSSGFPDEKLNLSLGVVQFLSSVLIFLYSSFILLKFKSGRVKKLSLLVVFLFFLSLANLFIIHPRSVFIWERFPLLHWFQFPWRFMTIVLFLTSVLIGVGLVLFRGRAAFLIGFSISVLAIVLNLAYFSPRDWYYDVDDSTKFSGELWEKQLTISIFDYLPIYSVLPPWEKAPELPEVIEGNASFSYYTKGSHYQMGRVDVLTNNALLRIPLFDFPGMNVFVDGKKVPHVNDNCVGQRYCLGLVTFSVSKGSHLVEIRLQDTPVRKIGNYLTLISFCAIVFLLVKKR